MTKDSSCNMNNSLRAYPIQHPHSELREMAWGWGVELQPGHAPTSLAAVASAPGSLVPELLATLIRRLASEQGQKT